MVVSFPVYFGTCTKLIKLTGFAAEFKTTQVPLFPEHSSREAPQTCPYAPCLPKTRQHSIYFTEFVFFLTAQDTKAFRNEIRMSDTALPPCPQHMASILVNNSAQSLR